METVNGFTVIAHKDSKSYPGAIVILGVRDNPHVSSKFEYVTAVMEPLAREWYWGHYITDLNNAVEDYNSRK